MTLWINLAPTVITCQVAVGLTPGIMVPIYTLVKIRKIGTILWMNINSFFYWFLHNMWTLGIMGQEKGKFPSSSHLGGKIMT